MKIHTPLCIALACSVTATVAHARTVTIELTNLTHGMFFTPRLASAHTADYHHPYGVNQCGSFTAACPSEPNDIPGGEFNFVTLHPGVASELEPLPGNTSQLNQSRKFDNPVIRIRITRVGS